VIDHLWDRLNSENRSIATFEDVSEAIKHCNATLGLGLSANNPANFMKDLLRGSSASENWPGRLAALRITGRQIKGENRIFEFVPYAEGQTEPFPNPFEPSGLESWVVVQSVSLPLTTKSLGRSDESWLVQVAVNLRVLESHFATNSRLKVVELTHLQVGVKLGRSEIDSIFFAVVEKDDLTRINALVTCEAKQSRDPILGDQIVQQVCDAFDSSQRLQMDVALIVPVAVKALAQTGAIYLVEFEPWTADEATTAEGELKELIVSSAGIYELRPPVPGVGYNPALQTRRARKPKI
jgi:hypothetical protein